MALNRTAASILGLPRIAKRAIVTGIDVSLCLLSVWLAFYLRLGEFQPLSAVPASPVLASVLLAIPLFIAFGLYRAIFRYAGGSAFIAISRAISVYGLFYAVLFTAVGFQGVPRTLGFIQPVLLFVLVVASRAFARYWLGGLYQAALVRRPTARVLVYGAGSSGRQIAAAMANSPELRIVGFLDDDRQLQGHTVNGLHVHDPARLQHWIEQLGVTDVLLAMPSAPRARRNQILSVLRQASVRVRTLPDLTEIAQGRVHASDLRELDVEDLLGRDSVPPNEGWLRRNIAGRTVLVTGAGGSIGSELCRQVLAAEPKILLMLEMSEFALYSIHQQLLKHIEPGSDVPELVPLLGSVLDARRVAEILLKWKPDCIYHAAAYKHVPLVEHNSTEGIRNNVFGTLTMATAAARYRVPDFVLVSTDKAVRPTNVMGASKRLAEMVLQALAAETASTRFSMVRFGNVLGSSGSVVPLFRQQIAEGGPITITHREITRYFMTIPEAAQLVIQAGAIAEGGEVFVLDMGEPVRVIDLAANMVRLAGLSIRDEAHPHGEIEITEVGLRPGEKLFEELLIGNNPQPTEHPLIMKASEHFVTWQLLRTRLDDLAAALEDHDVARCRALLQLLVPEFKAQREVVDWLYRPEIPAAPEHSAAE